jgi:hypothetical protein
MVKNINWKTIKDDGAPPFDVLCIVYGTKIVKDYLEKEYSVPSYCIAYNECYAPEICMTQVIELPNNCEVIRNNIGKAIYVDVPFEREKWCEIDV